VGGRSGTRAGRYAGRGPKGYRRSDARILEDVCEILTRDPEVDATDIDIRVENRVVMLGGTVNNRHAKRVAEDLTYTVRGIEDVRNEIRVVASADLTGVSESGAAGHDPSRR
jgi:osmotically-inducible protein OsmY